MSASLKGKHFMYLGLLAVAGLRKPASDGFKEEPGPTSEKAHKSGRLIAVTCPGIFSCPSLALPALRADLLLGGQQLGSSSSHPSASIALHFDSSQCPSCSCLHQSLMRMVRLIYGTYTLSSWFSSRAWIVSSWGHWLVGVGIDTCYDRGEPCRGGNLQHTCQPFHSSLWDESWSTGEGSEAALGQHRVTPDGVVLMV